MRIPATETTTTKYIPIKLLTSECLLRYSGSRPRRRRRGQRPDLLLSLKPFHFGEPGHQRVHLLDTILTGN